VGSDLMKIGDIIIVRDPSSDLNMLEGEILKINKNSSLILFKIRHYHFIADTLNNSKILKRKFNLRK